MKGIAEDGAKMTSQLITGNYIRRRNPNPPYFPWIINLDIVGFLDDFIDSIPKLCKKIKPKKDGGA